MSCFEQQPWKKENSLKKDGPGLRLKEEEITLVAGIVEDTLYQNGTFKSMQMFTKPELKKQCTTLIQELILKMSLSKPVTAQSVVQLGGGSNLIHYEIGNQR